MKTATVLLALGAGLLLMPEAEARVSGLCRFDTASLAFAGTAEEAATCLLRPVLVAARLGTPLTELPPTLKTLIGKPASLPLAKIRAYLAQIGLPEAEFGGDLDQGLSQTSEGVAARYFVIHDTSAPYLGNAATFPADIDQSSQVNTLSSYAGPNAVAHLFINRRGEVLTGHPFSVGWRATKLETQVVGVRARGLFIHVELIQPRRRNPAGPAGNDQFAPDPGFADIQYEKLALAYIIASVRGGDWLLPGFHAVIDSGISDGHDDPQKFDLSKFDETLGALITKIGASSP
jgi:hypothetical protein